MKKARIFLAAIALFAVAGGAVAFKAQRVPGDKLFIRTTTAINGPITCAFVTTVDPDGVGFSNPLATISVTAATVLPQLTDCNSALTYSIE